MKTRETKLERGMEWACEIAGAVLIGAGLLASVAGFWSFGCPVIGLGWLLLD